MCLAYLPRRAEEDGHHNEEETEDGGGGGADEKRTTTDALDEEDGDECRWNAQEAYGESAVACVQIRPTTHITENVRSKCAKHSSCCEDECDLKGTKVLKQHWLVT